MARYVMITLMLIVTVAIYASGIATGLLVAMKLDEVEPTPTPFAYPTGEQVLAELQKYRVSEGLPEFQLSETLCDNLVERWQTYHYTNSHAGLQEFVNREYPGIS